MRPLCPVLAELEAKEMPIEDRQKTQRIASNRNQRIRGLAANLNSLPQSQHASVPASAAAWLTIRRYQKIRQR
jgi:hypothetical protein